ncbi:hypothetical protein AB0K80_02785 [Streptomyces sp. NPDC052682]|uniref:hypothetical protein n=1 Tax=Streptomyces sp. NPDC052682 TaxID=3154954 RepID=UPI00343101E2
MGINAVADLVGYGRINARWLINALTMSSNMLSAQAAQHAENGTENHAGILLPHP